jgi:glutaredoxin 3
MENSATPITLYTTDPCSFCARAKGLLASRGLAYDEVNLSKDPEGRLELAQRTGMMSFPQIVVGERLVGGFNELLAADRDGRLDELLTGSGIQAQPVAPASAGSGIQAQPVAPASTGSGIQAQPVAPASAGSGIRAQPVSPASAA